MPQQFFATTNTLALVAWILLGLAGLLITRLPRRAVAADDATAATPRP